VDLTCKVFLEQGISGWVGACIALETRAERLRLTVMLKNTNAPGILLQMLLSLLSTSGTMAGISLALVGIVNLRITSTKVASIADDVFLFASLGFVAVCYMTFFAIRHIQSARLARWTDIIDLTFMLSLSLLVVGGFVTVYEFV